MPVLSYIRSCPSSEFPSLTASLPHAQENDRLSPELDREKSHRREIEVLNHELQEKLQEATEKLLSFEARDDGSSSITRNAAIGGFAFLKSIPLFQTLSEAQLSKLSTSLETRLFENSDVIIRQGDAGHSFYIVESGEVVVTRVGESKGSPGSESVLMTLGPGDYFGERALLTDECRAATCTAKGKVLCQVLVRETLTDALSSISDLLGDRLKEYEHDLNETSVQALASHIRIFTDALKKSRGGHNSAALYDGKGVRRGSSSNDIYVKRGKVLINILENINPESDIRCSGRSLASM